LNQFKNKIIVQHKDNSLIGYPILYQVFSMPAKLHNLMP